MVFLLTRHGILYLLFKAMLPWTGRVEAHTGARVTWSMHSPWLPVSPSSTGWKCHTTGLVWEVKLGTCPSHNMQPQSMVDGQLLGLGYARYLDQVWSRGSPRMRKMHHSTARRGQGWPPLCPTPKCSTARALTPTFTAPTPRPPLVHRAP